MLKMTESDKGSQSNVDGANHSKFKKICWDKMKAKSEERVQLYSAPSGGSMTKPGPTSSIGFIYCKANEHWKRYCNKYLAENGKGVEVRLLTQVHLLSML